MSRRKATSKTETTDSAIALTKAIQGITKAQDGFTKSVEQLNALVSDTFNDLELKLKTKQNELSQLEDKYVEEERSRKLEVDLNIKEHGYSVAQDILADRGEQAVPIVTYEELKRMYEELKQSHDADIENAVKREHDRNNALTSTLKKTLELQNVAEVAKVQAQLEAQVKQIQVLESTIERITHDLDEQRKLTKEVALASATSANKQPVYVQASERR